MNRRHFLVGTIAVLAAPSVLLANDPCLNDLKRSTLTVGTNRDGHLFDLFNVTGWEMNLEEDDKVLFDFVITNNGPKKVRAVHCQPFALGNWQVFQRFPDVGNVSGQVFPQHFRANNDSNFFFIEINTSGNNFVPMAASNDGDSSAHTDQALTVAHMEWHHPQEVHFEVRAKDTRS